MIPDNFFKLWYLVKINLMKFNKNCVCMRWVKCQIGSYYVVQNSNLLMRYPELLIKVLTILWHEIQFLGQTFGNIYIVSRNNLLTLFVVAFIVSLWFLLLLWITLNIIAIQPTTIINGPVKIKYTLDPIFYTSLNNYWLNIEIPDF